MDWLLALDRNRALLLRLFSLVSELISAEMSRETYLRALRYLRPAESALRRLIVIAAKDMAAPPCVPPCAPRRFPDGAVFGAAHVPCFALLDRRINPDAVLTRHAPAPRIRCIGDREAPAASASVAVPVAALMKRMACFKRALDDVPAAARRLARWRRAHPQDLRRPMRPGRPPGHRSRSRHWIDEALDDLQQLALLAMIPDTS